jgi:hypothetical protein
MKVLAEALLQSAAGADAQVSRQYAQALIDEGSLAVAEALLAKLHADPSTRPDERAEAGGLLGRLYKQMYVDARRPDQARQQDNLRKALRFYLAHYEADPAVNTWHGINVVALTARARRDNVALPADLQRDERALAEAVLAAAEKVGDEWSRPTRLEACVALGRWKDAADLAGEYAADEKTFDAFEIASTRRQLEQVWELSSGSDPGGSMMDELRAAEVLRVGGQAAISRRDLGAVRQANFDDEAGSRADGGRRRSSAPRASRASRPGRPRRWAPASWSIPPPSSTARPSRARCSSRTGTCSARGPDRLDRPGGCGGELRGDRPDGGRGRDRRRERRAGRVLRHAEGAGGRRGRLPPAATAGPLPQGEAAACVRHRVPAGRRPVVLHPRQRLARHGREHLPLPDAHGARQLGQPGVRRGRLARGGAAPGGGSRVPRLSGVGTYEANVGVAIEAIRQAVRANRLG